MQIRNYNTSAGIDEAYVEALSMRRLVLAPGKLALAVQPC